MDNIIELAPTLSGVVVTRRGVMETQMPLPPKSELTDRYHALWGELHSKQDPTSEWFSDWVSRVPQSSCGCRKCLSDYIVANPPLFDDWPKWTWEVHNAVNEKLLRNAFSWSDFVSKYRPDLWPVQPRISNLLLVTSLSPLPSHQEQQRTAIESWKRFGFDVLSVNLPHEIERLRENYDIEFIETNESCEQYNRKTPTINSLTNISVAKDVPIMIINSDCTLYGSQRLVTDITDVGIGIRHNWTDHLSDATQEQWGLDAFIMHPEHAKSLPRLPFGIGQPMWDYWVAWHMQQAGFQVDWIGEKLIYHKLHPTNWKPDDCLIGRQWITEHYKTDLDWVKWREQQPHTFSIFSPFRK